MLKVTILKRKLRLISRKFCLCCRSIKCSHTLSCSFFSCTTCRFSRMMVLGLIWMKDDVFVTFYVKMLSTDFYLFRPYGNIYCWIECSTDCSTKPLRKWPMIKQSPCKEYFFGLHKVKKSFFPLAKIKPTVWWSICRFFQHVLIVIPCFNLHYSMIGGYT